MLLAGSSVVSVAVGQSSIGTGDVLRLLAAGATGGTIEPDEVTSYVVVSQIRAPRVLLAALVGAGLTIAGILIQVLVRNPLADPYILGISAGASVGASAVVTFGVLSALGPWALSAAAFAGALVAAAGVWLASGGSRGAEPLRLVLVGVVLGLGFQAATSLIVFLAPRGEAARAVLFWLLGNLGAARWEHLLPVGLALALTWTLALIRSRVLDSLALGDETAHSLGVDVARTRRRLFVLTALLTGTVVAACGAVGFLGLVVPHVARLLVGPGHRRLLVIAPLLGALLCVWADTLCRVLVPPRELPLGVVTALIGVPVFLLLLRRGAGRLRGV